MKNTTFPLSALAAALFAIGCASEPIKHYSESFRNEGGDNSASATSNPNDQNSSAASRSELIAKLIGEMVPIPGQDFEISKYEVTQALWESVVGKNPSKRKGPDLPVESVNWSDCQEFVETLNSIQEVRSTGKPFRLPTDSEWEIACRAGGDGDYCRIADGTEITKQTLDRVAWFESNSNKGPHPVGQKEPNAFGLHDMIGNVWEWTASRFIDGKHEALPSQVGLWRGIRGGGWDEDEKSCRCFVRPIKQPRHKSAEIGFRLAR